MEHVAKPLEIPHILANIFSHLPLQDQKNFRLVNNLWMNSSLPHWRKFYLIRIDLRDFFNNLKYHKAYKNHEDYKWKEFFSICEGGENEFLKIKDIPFQRFQIYFTQKREFVLNKLQFGFTMLLNTFGLRMKYLEIVIANFHESFQETMSWILLEHCPNLEELNLRICRFQNVRGLKKQKRTKISTSKLQRLKIQDIERLHPDDEVITNIDGSNLRDFFKIIPNLKELSLHGSCSTSFLQAITSQVETRGRNETFIKLEYLELDVFRIEDHIFGPLLQYLELAQPPLRRVKLTACDLQSLREPPYKFHKFLTMCSPTLVKLHMEFNKSNNFWITDFTRSSLPNLEHLTLIFDEDEGKNRYIQFDFNGLCGMPKLKTFVCRSLSEFVLWRGTQSLSEEEMKYEGINPWMNNDLGNYDFFSQELQLPNLEEFEFDMIKNLNVDCLRRLGRTMKNLKHLKLVFGDEDTFLLVAGEEIFPNLETITLLAGSKVKITSIDEMKRGNPRLQINLPYNYDHDNNILIKYEEIEKARQTRHDRCCKFWKILLVILFIFIIGFSAAPVMK